MRALPRCYATEKRRAMPGDNLTEILAIARREAPDVPDQVWQRVEAMIRNDYGTQRIYIAAHRKRQHLNTLEALSKADQAADTGKLAATLGVSVRRVQQLKRIR